MTLYIFNFKRYVVVLLAVSLVLMVFTLICTEYYLRSQSLTNRANDVYKHRFLNGESPWVALGDSHPATALISKTWLDNLGVASDNLSSIEGKLDIILANRPHLKGVIMQADPQMFAYYRVATDQSERVASLRKLSDSRHTLLILSADYRPYLSSIVWSLLADPTRLINGGDTSHKPVEQVDKNSNSWRRVVALRVQLHAPVSSLQEHSSSYQYRRIIQRIIEKGVKVCLVTYPVSELYRKMANTVPSFISAHQFFQTLSLETGAKLIDGRAAFPETAFNDPDHLLPSEALAFTEFIYKACDVNYAYLDP